MSSRPSSSARTSASARRLRRWALHGLLGGLLAAGAALWLRGTPPLRMTELKTYDGRIRRTATTPADTNIVIIIIDDWSLRQLGPALGQWPWPREAYARALSFLTYAGARQVVFDVQFGEPDLRLPGSDTAFAEAIAAAGNVILPMTIAAGDARVERNLARLTGDGADAYLPRFSLPARAGAVRAPEEPRLDVPLPLFSREAAALGDINLNADEEDGVSRRTRLLYRHDGRAYPSLAVAAARLADPTRFGGSVAMAPEAARIGRMAVPLRDGRMLVRWRGPFRTERGETYRLIPFYRLTNSYEQIYRGDAPELDPASLAGKTVFIGVSASGLLDLRVTPFGSKEPGVLLHATVLDNLLRGDFLRRAPQAWNVGFAIVLAVAVGSAVALLGSALWEAAAILALPAAAVLTAEILFARGIWIDVAAPVLGGVLAGAGAMLAGYMTEGRDKKRVREMFSRYVSPEYVRLLVDEHESLHLGGQRVPITLLFSDIRGFTTLSERMPAESVVEMLNEYLACMTEVVFRHGGTLDKFIGDAVMAFWGAPLAVPDHAHRAAAAALDMGAELERLNERWRERGMQVHLEVGIGINTGDAIVGNIGSLSGKLDYTAIGDAVNLASRLEGLNKEFGTCVIVSETTRAALEGAYETRFLQEVQVKGKEQPVRIHELLGAADRAPNETVGAAARVATSRAAVLTALMLALGAMALPAQKARWTEQIYLPGRWQAGRVQPFATANGATDTLALVAQVDAYSAPPRWRAEIRKIENGVTGTPLVLLADRGNVTVLTGVSITPLQSHRAAADALVQAVVRRFDAAGKPRDPVPARIVERAPNGRVARVIVRRRAVSADFPDDLLAMSRGRRFTSSLLRGTAEAIGSDRSAAVVSTAGARGVADTVRVQTVDGVVTIRTDTVAVARMERRAPNAVAVDEFRRQGRIGGKAPVKEEQVP